MNVETDEHGKFVRGVAGRFTVGDELIECFILTDSAENLAELTKRFRLPANPKLNKRAILRREKA